MLLMRTYQPRSRPRAVPVEVVPSWDEVVLMMDIAIASGLPGALPGETISHWVARHRAAVTHRSVGEEKTEFHRQVALYAASVLHGWMPYHAPMRIAAVIFGWLESFDRD